MKPKTNHKKENSSVKKIFIVLLALALSLSAALAEESPSLPEGNAKAPVVLWSQFAPVDFRTAVNAAEEPVSIGGDIDYLSLVTFKAGKHVRMVTLLDDRARDLYMAAMARDAADNAYDVFSDYAWSLPVTYVEEITQKPKKQAELDALTGKTVADALQQGYVISGSGGGLYIPTTVDLAFGMFDYTFEADATFEEYMEHNEKEDLGSLKLKSGKLSGYSPCSSDLGYLADGTYAPQFVPNVTAEEAAAAVAAPVPPADEYTQKAWPLTAEGYSDLLNNVEERYGQVYMVEGVVHEVLSQSPGTVVIFTGEDGKSQPVIVEIPVYSSFWPEVGSSCRIYAEVSSAQYVLPVLTARYCFTE